MNRSHVRRRFAIDRSHSIRLFARGEVQVDARIFLQGADNRGDHRVVDGRTGVDQNSSYPTATSKRGLGPTQLFDAPAQQSVHARTTWSSAVARGEAFRATPEVASRSIRNSRGATASARR